MNSGNFPQPFAWLLLSLRKGFSSSAPLVALMSVSTLILAAVLVPVIAVSSSLEKQRSGSGVLTQIDVLAPDDFDSRGPNLTASSRETIRAIGGVTDVIAQMSVGVYAGAEGTWSTTVHTINPANLPPDVAREVAASIDRSEVIVPSSIEGTQLAATIGSELLVEYTQATGEQQGELRTTILKPIASYNPKWQGYGPHAIIASEEQVATLLAARHGLRVDDYLEKEGVPAFIVTAKNETAVDEVATELRALGFDARPTRDALGELPGIVSIFPAVFTATAIAVAIFTILLVGSVVRGSLIRRAREFGLLRVRGWKVRDVRALLVLDIGAGSALGAIGGTIGGFFAGTAINGVVNPTAGMADTGWPLLVGLAAIAVLPVSFAILIGLATSHRALSRDPYLALVQSG